MTDQQSVREAVELLIDDHGLDEAYHYVKRRYDEICVDDDEYGRVMTAYGIVERRRNQ